MLTQRKKNILPDIPSLNEASVSLLLCLRTALRPCGGIFTLVSCHTLLLRLFGWHSGTMTKRA
uniref:Uncharacterized protein n=1 Tax=Rhizophora mucronata TaxID=61149 RepID=A0A2P2JE83_RHIMU